MRELEAENARLKKAVAELTVDKIIPKEVAEGTSAPGATAAGGGSGAVESPLLRAPHLPTVGHRAIEHPVRAATAQRRGAAASIDDPPGVPV